VAVNRWHPDNGHRDPLDASQVLPLEVALAGYTSVAADLVLGGEEGGRIRVGDRADITVVDADPFSIPAEELASVGTTHTIVGGAVVYRA